MNNEERTLAVTEYKDVSDNIRQYSNFRFAQLTLLFAITGALLASLVNLTDQYLIGFQLRLFFGLGGTLISFVLWVMEERLNDYWHYFVKRAMELERRLHFEQYSIRPQRRLITATNAVRLLYASLVMFWTWVWKPSDWVFWLVTSLVAAYFAYLFLIPWRKHLD